MTREKQIAELVDFAKQCYSRFTFFNQSKTLPAVDDWQKYLPIDVSQTAEFLRGPVSYGYNLIRRLRVEKVCQCWKRQMKKICRDPSVLALPIKQGRRVH